MSAEKVKLCPRYFYSLIFSLIAIIVATSLCKKKPEDNYLEPVNVSNNTGRSEHPSMALDSKGTVHLVWNDDTPGYGQAAGNEQILYAFKPKGDSWTAPVNVSNTLYSGRFPSIAVDNNDNLHLAWQQWISGRGWVIFYSQKHPDSTWSIPETIIATGGNVTPKIGVDNSGFVFMVWYAGGYSGALYFSMRQSDGNWTLPKAISQWGYVSKSNYPMAIDRAGKVHVAWYLWDGGNFTNVFYTMWDTNGNWSQPSLLFAIDSFAFSPVLASDNNGNIHIAWNDSTLIYMVKSPEGNWSAPEFPGIGASPDAIAIDNNGTIYMSYYGTRLFKKTKEGKWEKPILVVERSGGRSSLAIDNEGIKHLTWDNTPPDTIDTSEIYYVEVKDY
jgi:hypothetical protein